MSKMNQWEIIRAKIPQLVRFTGKTFPCIIYSESKLHARDDNGDNVSETFSTEDISVKGIKTLLKEISLPHPSQEMIDDFLEIVKEQDNLKEHFLIQDALGNYIGENSRVSSQFEAKAFDLAGVKEFFENLDENEASGYAVLDTTVKMGAVEVPNPEVPPGMVGSGDNFKEAITPSLFKAPGKKAKHARRVKDYEEFLKIINYKTHSGETTVGKSKSSKDGGHVYTGDPTP